ncbi:nucleoside-diphosphate-sugar epimerase protein [Rutstroemia sp. NJR-2017a WRK4]|nr:nucleoside-diphosphate-sugar epimerase protein [Rutstroemia sp. NJR-2017a WRK4]
MASKENPKVALITGANGISGAAVLKQLSSNPIWSEIHALSRSPPTTTPSDPRIHFHTLDLSAPLSTLTSFLQSHNLTHITHFFHYAYIHSPSLIQQAADNIPLFHNTVYAIDTASSSTLERVILQTGGKDYGIHAQAPPSVPLVESQPRTTNPNALPMFYYTQEDDLWALKEKRGWSWNVTLPFWINGYVPKSGMSWTTSAGMYFSLWGRFSFCFLSCDLLLSCVGSSVMFYQSLALHIKPAIFPGDPDKSSYRRPQHFSTASVIGSFTEWLALNPSPEVQNQRFNIVDDTVTTFEDIWVGVGKYFGVEPKAVAGHDLRGEIEGILGEWEGIGGSKDALKLCTWDIFVGSMAEGDWGSDVSMEKARGVGWEERADTVGEMGRVFEEMRGGGLIPVFG